MAKSTVFLLPGCVATCAAYWSTVNTCSSSADSCASPKIPRVLTLVSRCFRSPTPCARVCISPKPLWTCSSLSATCLKLSPKRVSKVVCSFSSTVLRISSSLAELLACNWASCFSRVSRTSPMRRALDSLTDCNCITSVSDSVFCSSASCWPKASICVFCVRIASALCCVSVCWKVANVVLSSCRLFRPLSTISRRTSRSVLSLPSRTMASNSAFALSGCFLNTSHNSSSALTINSAKKI